MNFIFFIPQTTAKPDVLVAPLKNDKPTKKPIQKGKKFSFEMFLFCLRIFN